MGYAVIVPLLFNCQKATDPQPQHVSVTIVSRARVDFGSTVFDIPFDIYLNGILQTRGLEYGDEYTVQLTPGTHLFSFEGDDFLRQTTLGIVEGGGAARLIVYPDRVECPLCTSS